MLSTHVTTNTATDVPGRDEILAATPLPDDMLCVYAAGASAVGWGHARSDLDVYVVSRSSPRIAWNRLAELGAGVEPDEAVVPRLSPLVAGVQAEIGDLRAHPGGGVLSVKAKWRARRVAEVQPPGLPWDDYWAVETFRGYEPEHGREWVETVVA